MKAYKFLASGARGRFSDAQWPTSGEWLVADGPLEECRHGIHACTAEQLLDWLDDELWELELGAPVHACASGLVAGRGRLLRLVPAWNRVLARAFAERCVDGARRAAVELLRRIGSDDEADALMRAASLADVKAVAARTCRGPAAEATAFAADCMLLAVGARPEDPSDRPRRAAPDSAAAIAANLGFVSAHAAGRAAVLASANEASYAPAFDAERADQLAWLLRQLGL